MTLSSILRLYIIAQTLLCCFDNQSADINKQQSSPKKKIMLFWSKGGGCHKAMIDALEPMLKDTYDVTSVNFIEKILHPIDPIYSMTHGKKDGEDLYNYCLSHDWIRTTNLLVEFGHKAMYWRHNKIVALVEEFLSKEKPDMLISVVPLFNSAFAEACKKLNIPFILTIMDNVHLYFALKPPQDPMEFRCTIPFNDALWNKHLKKIRVNPATIKGVGFPLRKDFFEKKDVKKIKAEFNIPTDKPVIMILMGGAGSAKTTQYVRRLSRIKEPLHIIVCCGRAETLKAELERIKKPANITVSIIGFTKRISDLMAASDVIITKSGPASLFETFESQLPVLVDRTCGTVTMEKLLVETVNERQFGDTIFNLRRLPQKIDRLLHDKEYRATLKKNVAAVSNRNFERDFKKIIADFFADKEQAAQRTKEQSESSKQEELIESTEKPSTAEPSPQKTETVQREAPLKKMKPKNLTKAKEVKVK